MAFINEIVPENEKKEYQIAETYKKIPYQWTIDRERDIKLFKWWTNIDSPHEVYFALIWKETVIRAELEKSFPMENCVKWSLLDITLPRELMSEKDTILNALREAMHVYGVSGFSFHRTLPADVIIDF